jgi:sulfopyruvate decarboxylase TPP-binding subunit
LKADDSFLLVPVASEAEAVGIAAGAALGGKQPAVYMEGTGLFVSSYNLLTLGERYGVPMLLLISYIGGMDDQRSTFSIRITARIWFLNYRRCGNHVRILKDDVALDVKIANAVRMMQGLKQPVALLFTGNLRFRHRT